MTIADMLAFVSAGAGFLAAILWCRSALIVWNVGREGLPLGQYVSRPRTFHGPNDLALYLRSVSAWNFWAALATAAAVALQASSTIAEIIFRASN